MKTLLITCLAALLLGCSEPSCKEKGGEMKLSHYQPILIGKVTTLTPMYKCVTPNDANPN